MAEDFLKDDPRHVRIDRHGSMTEGFTDWRISHPRVIVASQERDEWDALYAKLGPEGLGRLYNECLRRGAAKCYLSTILEMLADEQDGAEAKANQGKREWRSYCANHERELRILLLDPSTTKQREWHDWLLALWNPPRGAEEVFSTLVNGGAIEVWRELITSKVFPVPPKAACEYAKGKA